MSSRNRRVRSRGTSKNRRSRTMTSMMAENKAALRGMRSNKGGSDRTHVVLDSNRSLSTRKSNNPTKQKEGEVKVEPKKNKVNLRSVTAAKNRLFVETKLRIDAANILASHFKTDNEPRSIAGYYNNFNGSFVTHVDQLNKIYAPFVKLDTSDAVLDKYINLLLSDDEFYTSIASVFKSFKAWNGALAALFNDPKTNYYVLPTSITKQEALHNIGVAAQTFDTIILNVLYEDILIPYYDSVDDLAEMDTVKMEVLLVKIESLLDKLSDVPVLTLSGKSKCKCEADWQLVGTKYVYSCECPEGACNATKYSFSSRNLNMGVSESGDGKDTSSVLCHSRKPTGNGREYTKKIAARDALAAAATTAAASGTPTPPARKSPAT